MGSFAGAVKAEIIKQYQNVASARVINAVETASEKTGVDFKFLMEKASTESSFDPSAKSRSSSATGLYQFIDDTWLHMVKEHGEKYGLGDMADKIEIKNGKACVDDGSLKKEILALRKNPEISACMAGEFSADNAQYLEQHTDSNVGSTELYLAHFMGAGGAAKFLNARAQHGSASAAALFPAAAKANKNIFYDKSGKARSLDAVYNLFSKKFTGGQAASSSTVSASTASQPTQAPAATAASSTRHTHMAHLSHGHSGVARALSSSDVASAAASLWQQAATDQTLTLDADAADSDAVSSGFTHSSAAVSRLASYSIIAMSQMNETLGTAASVHGSVHDSQSHTKYRRSSYGA